jgi:hypothetical protein
VWCARSRAARCTGVSCMLHDALCSAATLRGECGWGAGSVLQAERCAVHSFNLNKASRVAARCSLDRAGPRAGTTRERHVRRSVAVGGSACSSRSSAARSSSAEGTARSEASCNTQRATCSVQHAACNMQNATCSVQHAACNMQHATCKMQRATCKMQRATCSVQLAACNMQWAKCSVQHAITSGQHATCSMQHADEMATVSRNMDRHAPRFPVKTATVMSEHTGVFNTVATCASAASAASSCVAAGTMRRCSASSESRCSRRELHVA